MTLPAAIPGVLPMGEYVCEIKAEAEKKASQFDPSKSYFELPLSVQNANGEYFDFNFVFNPKTPIYPDFLKLLGGQTQPTGIISPPLEPYVGKKFMARITERPAKNDKSRMVNEIIAVWLYNPEQNPEEKKEEKNQSEPQQKETEDEVPF